MRSTRAVEEDDDVIKDNGESATFGAEKSLKSSKQKKFKMIIKLYKEGGKYFHTL